jgi:hypothetical protein
MSASGSKSELAASLTPGQSALLEQLTGLLGEQLGQGVEAYPGELSPEASELQQLGFQQAAQDPAQLGEFQSAISRLLGGGDRAAFEVDPEARRKVYEAQTAQAGRQFQTQTIPQLMEFYNARGLGRSGGLERALAGAGGELALRGQELQANLEYQDEQARRGALESGANRQLQSRTAGAQGFLGGQAADQTRLQALLGAGGVQRDIAGQGLQADYQKWMQAQPYGNPWLQFLPQALGTAAFTPVSSAWGVGLG